MARRKVKEPAEPWLYNGQLLTEEADPSDYYGFIYKITNKETGQFYIGKKNLHSYKTEITHVLNERTGRMNKVRNILVSESNWRDYFGSSVEIKTAVKELGKSAFTREILLFVQTKKQLTYYETKYQFITGCIEPGANSYNSNILGKFYPGDFYSKDSEEELGDE